MTYKIVAHNPLWENAFCNEASEILAALSGISIALHHIGSTSIKGVFAKPIIDLLGTVPNFSALGERTGAFEKLGYESMGAYGIKERQYFRKANALGERTHHLHIYQTQSPHVERHLAFRDYLIAHPKKAAEYSDLKKKLISAKGATQQTYVNGKEPFILATQRDALRWYRSA